MGYFRNGSRSHHTLARRRKNDCRELPNAMYGTQPNQIRNMKSNENKSPKKFTLKQKVFLYFYKSKQYLNYKRHRIWLGLKRFVDSLYFYLIVIGSAVLL